MGKNLLQEIWRSEKTVFSFKDLILLSQESKIDNLKSKVHYYVTKGYLYPIRRGIYAKNKDYNRLEVASKIFAPSYISFETVLRDMGMIFQYYTSIFVATYRSETIDCDGQRYIFRTIKPIILTNNLGVTTKKIYTIATPERAFLDILYIRKNYHFDNLSPLNWEKVYDILPLYENKRMEQVVKEKHTRYQEQL